MNPELEELKRLGEEIAVLSAEIEVATARLLDLIRDFDARGGWANGFKTCADWLSWRVGMDRGAAHQRVRPRRAVLLQGPGAHAGRHAGDGRAAPEVREVRHGRPRRAPRARLAPSGPQRREPGSGQRHKSRAL